MGLFSLEHSKTVYVADWVFYGLGVMALAVGLLIAAPPAQSLSILLCVGLGLMAWSALEYGVHRFVFHGLAPFRRWHTDHHARPGALLGTPTILSATLLALLLSPAWVWCAPWHAGGLSLGVLMGYLGYALTHHAIHHWRAHNNPWLKRRKAWHAWHHQSKDAAFYGVTSPVWDLAFGTARADKPPMPSPVRQQPPQPPHDHRPT